MAGEAEIESLIEWEEEVGGQAETESLESDS